MSFLKVLGQSLVSTLDKPVYEVVSKEEGYEERRYKPAKWVSTTIESGTHDEARRTGFRRLFKYITGENEKETTVAMTAPVLTKVLPKEGPEKEDTFIVSFYLPVAHQEEPFKPKSPEVFLEEFPEIHVYVTTFGGFAKDSHFVEAKAKLTELLKGKKFDEKAYYTAGYDSPMTLFNRTNELWLIKQEE